MKKRSRTYMKAISVFCLTVVVGLLWTVSSFGQATALLADLVVSFKAPATAFKGQVITDKIKITVKNKGGLEAKNFHVDIVLKETPTIEHMCGRGFIMSLKPGRSISTPLAMQLPVSIPGGIKPGRYQLCAVVDPTSVVREYNETNNRVCQTFTIVLGKPKPISSPLIPKAPVK